MARAGWVLAALVGLILLHRLKPRRQHVCWRLCERNVSKDCVVPVVVASIRMIHDLKASARVRTIDILSPVRGETLPRSACIDCAVLFQRTFSGTWGRLVAVVGDGLNFETGLNAAYVMNRSWLRIVYPKSIRMQDICWIDGRVVDVVRFAPSPNQSGQVPVPATQCAGC